MSPSTLKNIGIGLIVLCGVLLFVAVERYQANVASVAAMNQMMQSSPFGQNSPLGQFSPFGQSSPMGHMTPGVPASTTYAVLFALLSAGGAVVCFVQAKRSIAAT
jgi:hypothetical protein